MVAGVRRKFYMRVVLEAFENRRLVAQPDVQRVGEENVALLARIHAAPKDAVAQQVVCGNAQPLDDGATDVALGVIEW